MNRFRRIKIILVGILAFLLAIPVSSCGRKSEEDTKKLTVPDHIGKARVLYHQGDYAGAVEMYHKSLELNPDNADIYLQLGIIYDDNLKDEEQAVYYYNQFLIRDPESDKAKRIKDWIAKSKEMISEGNGSGETGSAEEDSGQPHDVHSPAPAVIARPKVSPEPSKEEGKPGIPGEAEIIIYTVGRGDTLAGIAEEFYGDRTAWKKIYQANRDKLANPNSLKVGQELSIPVERKRAVIEMPK
jgi:tetratricopeptide (TPR) repeat protein